MYTKDLVGAMWVPSDGHITPADLNAALGKAARMNGVKIYEGYQATGFEVNKKTNRVESVITNKGKVEC